MSGAALETLQVALETSYGARVEMGLDMPVVTVERARLLDCLKGLRRDERLEFAHCSGVTACDDFPAEPRFTLVYHFYSYKLATRVRVKCALRSDESAPSAVSIWPAIDCHERETFDMFGVRFEGHPDLKRILMPEGYKYHPLRKDFPLEGIEPDRLYREWEQGRNP